MILLGSTTKIPLLTSSNLSNKKFSGRAEGGLDTVDPTTPALPEAPYTLDSSDAGVLAFTIRVANWQRKG